MDESTFTVHEILLPASSQCETQAKGKTGGAQSGKGSAGASNPIIAPPAAFPAAAGRRLLSVHERYLELSRRPRASACDYCGGEAAEGSKKLQVCSTCHRKAYCSAACQRMDWKEGGHKRSCRPRKDFRKGDVVAAQGIEPEITEQLMVVEGPAAAAEGLWLVMEARKSMMTSHAKELRLVVPVEEREDL